MANKLSIKYFKYAIGEILLVVIGILIALQINNWNESRKNSIFERKVISELSVDVSQDIEEMNNALDSIKQSQRSSYAIIQHLENKNKYRIINLSYLDCQINNLSSLDVRNGNNMNFTHFKSSSNDSLNCISVDDDAWSTANWIYIDLQHYFSNNCNAIYGCVYDPHIDMDTDIKVIKKLINKNIWMRSCLELGISHAMMMHLSCVNKPSRPNQCLIDLLEDDLLENSSLQRVNNGFIIQDSPGLGIVVNDEKVSKYHKMYLEKTRETYYS